jgi:hypothetical protein
MTRNGRTLIWLAAGTFVLAVLGANAHLAYVAFASQPGCIAHVKVGEGAGTGFSAAASSC